jgi:transposase-like protein
MRTKSQSMAELPVPNTGRWSARRKAAVVAAVAGGVITIEEACRRYHMSEEEFFGWQRAFENGGLADLRQKRLIRPSRPGPRHSAGLMMTRTAGRAEAGG